MIKNQPGFDKVRYEVITQQDSDSDDVILPIPEPLLRSLGWKEGDEIEIGINQDGSMFLKRK
jgi:hypothetical protein